MELASICRRAHTEFEGTAILSRSRGRDRWFESTFLQRRVCELSVPRRRKMPKSRKNTLLGCRRRQSALVDGAPARR
jgi:hypothetical protein